MLHTAGLFEKSGLHTAKLDSKHVASTIFRQTRFHTGRLDFITARLDFITARLDFIRLDSTQLD